MTRHLIVCFVMGLLLGYAAGLIAGYIYRWGRC